MKKIVALTLAVILAFGMMTVGFAAAGDRVDKVSTLGTSSTVPADLNNVVLTSDNTLKVYLEPGNFTWKNNQPAGTTADPMTLSNLSGVSVKTSWKKGGEFFNAPELKYDKAAGTCFIELKTKKGINATKDMDIDGEFILSKGGTAKLAIAGLLANVEVATYDDDSAWVGQGNYIKANDFVKNLEVNFDDSDDVQVYLNVFSGKKYYIWVKEDVLPKDEELIAKYPGIEAVYHAYFSSNVNVPSTYVTFDLDEKYYVYNQDGKYLGTTDEKLALSTVYYLSSVKLEGFGEEPAEEPAASEPATPANPAGGGDDNVENATDNPGTGSNGFMNVAVVAGAIALAAAGAVSLKK